jgi:LPS sulfotransferase NodH
MGQNNEAEVDGGNPTLDRYPRLKPFQVLKSLKLTNEVAPVSDEPWPEVEACLVVLFTARSGSTFLSRELEIAFEVGKMGETLNPSKQKKRTLQKVIAKRKGSWFSAKAGVPGVVSGEFCGFFDTYLDKISFMRLMRRDIVAQAVSTAKALQTRAWHAHITPVAEAQYDTAVIADALVKIDRNVMLLRQYAQLTGRPCLPLIYEDFAYGDLTPALATGDALGVPRHKSEEGVVARPVQKMGDATNDAWIARFNEEMDSASRECIARYLAAIEDDLKNRGGFV